MDSFYTVSVTFTALFFLGIAVYAWTRTGAYDLLYREVFSKVSRRASGRSKRVYTRSM